MRTVVLGLLLALTSTAQAQQGSGIFYPSAAQEQGIGGRAVLECLVDDDGRLACEVTEEEPAGMAFGAAALRMSQHWRIAPRTRDGVSTSGGRIRRELVFEPGPPPHVWFDPTASDGIRWAEQPNPSDYGRLYPDEAMRRRVDGQVTLSCLVNDSYGLDCEVADESPTGQGFGRATLRLAEKFRVAPQTATGESPVGRAVRRTIRWVAN